MHIRVTRVASIACPHTLHCFPGLVSGSLLACNTHYICVRGWDFSPTQVDCHLQQSTQSMQQSGEPTLRSLSHVTSNYCGATYIRSNSVRYLCVYIHLLGIHVRYSLVCVRACARGDKYGAARCGTTPRSLRKICHACMHVYTYICAWNRYM